MKLISLTITLWFALIGIFMGPAPIEPAAALPNVSHETLTAPEPTEESPTVAPAPDPAPIQKVIKVTQKVVIQQTPATTTIQELEPPTIEILPPVAQTPSIIQPPTVEVVVHTTPMQQEPTPQPTPTTEPIVAGPVVDPTPVATTIELFNPIPGKGAGREYIAADPMVDESNYVELGAIVRDQNGNAMDGVTVTITGMLTAGDTFGPGGDETQSKVLEGTGNYSRTKNCNYYPFHYEFHKAGTHTITWSADGKVVATQTFEVK